MVPLVIPPRLRRSRRRRRRNSVTPPPPPPPQMDVLPPQVYTVSFYTEKIFVRVAKKAIHVHEWIMHVKSHCPHAQILVGLDTEWLPNMSPTDDHPIAVIQLCVGNWCLIYQVVHSDVIPASLHAFLADPQHVFCGVGIDDDIKKLFDHHGLRVGQWADLNTLRRLAYGEDNYRYLGLKKMAMAVLGKEMKKPLEVTLSKWDAVDLDLDQIEYATIDAFVSFCLGFMLWSVIHYVKGFD